MIIDFLINEIIKFVRNNGKKKRETKTNFNCNISKT